MIKFFTFVWEIVEGIVNVITRLVTSIGDMTTFIVGFGVLGAFIAALLAIRIIKWVSNR